jgi:transposase-like protein
MLFAAGGGRAMLVELSVMEQRYHAVMEVISGTPVTEVAGRYGVSRQAVHGWLGRYERDGLAGLADHSHRPARQPRQLDAEIVPLTLAAALALTGTSPGTSNRTRTLETVKHHLKPRQRSVGPRHRPGPGPARLSGTASGTVRHGPARFVLSRLTLDTAKIK